MSAAHPLSRAASRPRSDAGLAVSVLRRLSSTELQAIRAELAEGVAEQLRFEAAQAFTRSRMTEPEFRQWLRAAATVELVGGGAPGEPFASPAADAWPDAATLPLGPQ